MAVDRGCETSVRPSRSGWAVSADRGRRTGSSAPDGAPRHSKCRDQDNRDEYGAKEVFKKADPVPPREFGRERDRREQEKAGKDESAEGHDPTSLSPSQDRVCHRGMERIGIEPMTSGLQSRRSPS